MPYKILQKLCYNINHCVCDLHYKCICILSIVTPESPLFHAVLLNIEQTLIVIFTWVIVFDAMFQCIVLKHVHDFHEMMQVAS
jgi:hypothetical protein